MIVIRFWYIVSNVFVYLSCLNIISVPGCRAANETDDAYAYSEEKTDLETFSPELTEPIPKDFFEGVDNVGAFEDVNGSDAETSTNSSDLCTESITISLVSVMNQTNSSSEAITMSPDHNNSTTTPVAPPTRSDAETNTTDLLTESITISPVSVMNQTNSSSEAITMSPDLHNNSTTTPVAPLTRSDAETNTTDLLTESITTLPVSVINQTNSSSEMITMSPNLYNESTTTPVAPLTRSDAETNTTDLLTESITTLPVSVMNQTNSSSEMITMSPNLYNDSTTTPAAPPTRSDAEPNTTDLCTESITEVTAPLTTDSGTLTDFYNETKPTIPLNSSDAATNSSDLHIHSITMKTDLYTAESTTKPVTSDSNSSESAYIADFSTNSTATIISSTLSEQTTATNITIEWAINNASISEQPNVSSVREPNPENLTFSTKLLEEFNELVEKPTQPLVINAEKDTLEQLYDEDAKYTTKFTPRYEEGYYDPKRAPTRYGQHEEVVKTTMWKFASDYTIGIRDYNLILYAVNNTLVLEKGSLLNYVYFVFKEILHVNMTLCDIRYCRYLRSKTHDNSKKVPPVLVAFTKMDVKNEILHKRKMLRPTGIKVEHDMPKKILDEQNALLKPLMDKYRAMGQYVVVRSGKLLVEGKVLTQINLPDKYTYDPLQTFVSYVSTTLKPTTTPGIYELPREFADYGFGGDKKSGRRKKGGKGAGGKKKRKPMIRIPLDDEIGDELSVEILFTTRKFW